METVREKRKRRREEGARRKKPVSNLLLDTNGVWVTRVSTRAELCVVAGVSLRDDLERLSQHFETALISANSSLRASAALISSLDIQQVGRRETNPVVQLQLNALFSH
jgi:hypothetical protein